jgi:hypothetical protein
VRKLKQNKSMMKSTKGSRLIATAAEVKPSEDRMQRYEAIALSGPNEGIYATLISLPLFSTALGKQELLGRTDSPTFPTQVIYLKYLT